ncbi:5-formyltetrahydrofolate cyclo-ligase [Neiella marina]|uniref:5-formyltetrahydrofolate cyclo-ligase n=1 Tax=Neiella marina TaxID=508461 RepID=A0A8J2U3Q1_9GAMM|nr:5-formyltetrahydrofolate cyclo-ligase [Neiella marina]GGA71941.1 5-formyltetrahydrofolate cyclo-ligase [Neiella marina]
MNNLMAERATLRKLLRQKRQALSSSDQTQASINLDSQLQSHAVLQQAKTIAVYLANDGEIDLTRFCHWCWHHDKQLCLPVLHPFSKSHLLFLKYQPTTPMKRNRFGIFEPELNATQVVPLGQLDAILLPLVGFDSDANRLGMGGGFYDRTLSQWHQQRHPATALLGVAHECQQVPGLPIASWDVPLDAVITPACEYSRPTYLEQ